MDNFEKYKNDLSGNLGYYKSENTKVILGGIMRFRNLGINSGKLLIKSLISLGTNAFEEFHNILRSHHSLAITKNDIYNN